MQVGGERLHRAVVHAELAVRIAAGRDEQQRTAARPVELVLVERNRLPREVREHRQRIAEIARLDADEHLCDGVTHGYAGH